MRLRMLAVVLLTTGGGIVASGVPATAYSYCERYADKPTFQGERISGGYSVTCSRAVNTATLWGRIKEDRNNLPDVVHDTESVTFRDDKNADVVTTTCQDDDDIYTEAQINNEAATGSTRAEMEC